MLDAFKFATVAPSVRVSVFAVIAPVIVAFVAVNTPAFVTRKGALLFVAFPKNISSGEMCTVLAPAPALKEVGLVFIVNPPILPPSVALTSPLILRVPALASKKT